MTAACALRSLRLRSAARAHRAAAGSAARCRAAAGGAAAAARRNRGSRRARPAGPACARRRAGRQRHQGDPGAALRPAHRARRPSRRSRRRCTSGSTARAGALSCGRRSGSQPGDIVRFGDEGKVCFLGQLDATVEDKGEGGEVTLSFAFHGAGARPGDRRARRHAAAALHRRQAPADERDRDRLPDAVRARGGLGRGADRRPAFHRRAGRAARGARRRDAHGDAACRRRARFCR